MVFYIVFVYLSCQFCVSLDIHQCEGRNGKKCCVGYKWNHTLKSCTKCETGFYGPNCTTKCPQGTYGMDCQQICSCEIKDCHHVFGCFTDSTQTTYNLNVDKDVATIGDSHRGDNKELHPKPNQMCSNTSPPTKPQITMMITGIIVLATVALIISISNLFIHRLTGRLELTDHLRNLPDIIHV